MKKPAVFACAVVSATAMSSPARANLDIVWTNEMASGFDPAERNVINAAIGVWESLIVDYGGAAQAPVFSVEISETQTFAVGAVTSVTQGVSGLPAAATMILDDGTAVNTFSSWFVDPTPNSSEEFLSSPFAHYGGAVPGGVADGAIDYFNVVVHEFGHALGFSEGYSLWAAASNNGNGQLTYGPGQTIGLLGTGSFNSLSHLHPSDAPFDLMLSAGTFPGPSGPNGGGFDDRRLPSALDLDILAGIYGFTVDYTALGVVPSPGTASVAFTLLFAGALRVRR